MGLFSPYQHKDKDSGEEQPSSPEQSSPSGRVKKTVPTPSRKAAEAARRERVRPVVSRKEAKSRERAANRESRLAAMEATDKQPGRTLVRHFIDSRWSVGEWLMPALVATILVSLIGQQIWGVGADTVSYQIMNVSMIATYAILVVSVIEIVINWQRFKALLRERFPKETPKGLLFYFFNRSISIRGMRQPKPEVKRGEKF